MVHRLRLQTRRMLPIVTCPYRQRVPPTSIAGSHLLLGLERRREPVKAFIEPIAGRGASGLNVPERQCEQMNASRRGRASVSMLVCTGSNGETG